MFITEAAECWRHWPNILPSLGLLKFSRWLFLPRTATDTDNICMSLIIVMSLII